MVTRSTPSVRSHAGRRLMSSHSCRPDEKPVKTQMSIRRLNSASRHVRRAGAAAAASALAAPEPIDRELTAEIRRDTHGALARQHDALDDVVAAAREERVEV